MGRIPKASGSGVRISGGRQANRLNPREFGAGGREIQAAGQILGQAEERFRNLRDTQQVTAATTQANKALRQLEFDADNEPNPYNVGRFETEVSALRGTIGKDITDPNVRAKFDAEFEISSTNSLFNIRSRMRTRQNDLAKATLDESLRSYEDIFRSSETPAQKKLILKRIDNLIDTFAKNGVLKFEAAGNLKQTTREDLVQSEIIEDVQDNPDAALQRIESGFYERAGINLGPKEKKELVEFAEKAKARAKKERKALLDQAEEQTEAEVAVMLSKNEISLNRLRELTIGMRTDEGFKKISTSFFQAAEKRLTTAPDDEKIPKSQKAAVYADLLDQFTDLSRNRDNIATGNDLDVIRKFRENVITGAASLSQRQSDFFIENTQKNFDEAREKKGIGLHFLRGFAAQFVNPDQIFAKLGERFVERTFTEPANGEEAIKIANDIKREELLERHPSLAGQEDIPSTVLGDGGFTHTGFDSSKAKAHFIFRDGELVPADSPNKKEDE